MVLVYSTRNFKPQISISKQISNNNFSNIFILFVICLIEHCLVLVICYFGVSRVVHEVKDVTIHQKSGLRPISLLVG